MYVLNELLRLNACPKILLADKAGPVLYFSAYMNDSVAKGMKLRINRFFLCNIYHKRFSRYGIGFVHALILNHTMVLNRLLASDQVEFSVRTK